MSGACFCVRRATGTDILDISIARELQYPQALVWVCTKTGTSEIAGHLVLWLGVGEAELHDLFVVERHRRQGAARALLAHAIADLPCDITRLLLEVRLSNQPARALYEAMGFSEIGLRARYYRDGEDALVMEKVIDANVASIGPSG